ncbi:hypothetical protein [Corynebacterium sp. A21]|uniref:hypothetical protein n=1 Tax=Corynebacterium sp. A21 TaxID=3457318 RepID=UPI003FD498E8
MNQGLDQLFRETTAKPADEQGQQDAVNAYSEGTYQVAGHLIGRARGAGFAASLNEVSVKVQEGEQTVTVSLEADAYDPGEEARLGRLFFSIEGSSLPPAEVGPIAWSEGIRMAEYIWAGRTIEEEKE